MDLKEGKYLIKGEPRFHLNGRVFELEGTIQKVMNVKDDAWMDTKLTTNPACLGFVLSNKPSKDKIYYGHVECGGIVIYGKFLIEQKKND